jgi:hypothetical protein
MFLDYSNVTCDTSPRDDAHQTHRWFARDLQRLIESAALNGVVLTIELEPIGHCMGSYVMKGHVRGAR